MLTPTILLDDLFDQSKGWTYPSQQIPVRRTAAHDGNPCYAVSIDGMEFSVCEQKEWSKDGERNEIPARLVIKIDLSGIVFDKESLLKVTSLVGGIPALGMNDNGVAQLVAAVPIVENLPLDLARKQLMMCMSVLADEARVVFQKFKPKSAAGAKADEIDWSTMKNVASVAGALIAGFVGVS